MEMYGSFINRLAEHSQQCKPEIGMGATEMLYSDREPYEVISIKDDRHITVRRLKAIRTDKNGMSEDQDYRYEQDLKGDIVNLFLTKKGKWRERYKNGCLGNVFVLGHAEKYYDYSF